jgi:hypothetical protein
VGHPNVGSRWGHEGVWKLGDGGGIGCLFKSSLVHVDIIGVGVNGLVFAWTKGAIHVDEGFVCEDKILRPSRWGAASVWTRVRVYLDRCRWCQCK